MPSSYAYHREVENTYLVRDRDRQRRRDLLRVVLWVLPMAAAVLGYIWLQVRVLDSAYEIGRLEEELTAADRHHDRLSLEVARRTGLPLVEERARRELGMVSPQAESTLFWPEVASVPPSAPLSEPAPSEPDAIREGAPPVASEPLPVAGTGTAWATPAPASIPSFATGARR